MLAWLGVTAAILASDDGSLGRVLALERDGQDAQALELADALVRREPTAELPRLEAARLRLKLGRELERAEQHADTARSLAPENPRAHFLLALALLERGALPQAQLALEVALALREDYQDARLRLAGVLFQEGRFADAAEHYRRYADAHPQDTASRLQLATALERAEQLKAAEQVLRGLATTPVQRLAWRRLAELAERQGRADEAHRLRAKADPPKHGLRPLQPSAR